MLVVVLPDGSGGAKGYCGYCKRYCEYAFRYFEMLVVVLPDGGGAADGPNVAIGLAEQDFPTTSAPGHQVRPHPAPGLGSPPHTPALVCPLRRPLADLRGVMHAH